MYICIYIYIYIRVYIYIYTFIYTHVSVFLLLIRKWLHDTVIRHGYTTRDGQKSWLELPLKQSRQRLSAVMGNKCTMCFDGGDDDQARAVVVPMPTTERGGSDNVQVEATRGDLLHTTIQIFQ